ncbi:MAG: hypothetical protein M1825_003653 [Sarcosagium campestre]|nr:MAG: hypothetical protein M1825_003653 [Sarcosagium campestre]
MACVDHAFSVRGRTATMHIPQTFSVILLLMALMLHASSIGATTSSLATRAGSPPPAQTCQSRYGPLDPADCEAALQLLKDQAKAEGMKKRIGFAERIQSSPLKFQSGECVIRFFNGEDMLDIGLKASWRKLVWAGQSIVRGCVKGMQHEPSGKGPGGVASIQGSFGTGHTIDDFLTVMVYLEIPDSDSSSEEVNGDEEGWTSAREDTWSDWSSANEGSQLVRPSRGVGQAQTDPTAATIFGQLPQ